MKPFLKQVAESIVANPEWDKQTLIFPNRRAPLYFRQYLAQGINKPVWEPKLIPIASLFSSLSNLHEPDRLTLIHRLHKIYVDVMDTHEPFYRFYFWGDILLNDFDQIDKYQVDASMLFKNLSTFKELDESFDVLSEEQKEFLKKFWATVQQRTSENKNEFLKIWKALPKIYLKYVSSLKQDALGYEGMIQKMAVLQLTEQSNHQKEPNPAQFVFVGFNALTKTEEALMCYYVKLGARVYWDTDAYYMNNPVQEAGRFLRHYQQHPILSKTFETPFPFLIQNRKESKDISFTGVPQRVGQARLVGQKLSKENSLAINPEQTVIVLPDDNMLLPMLYALPPELDRVNVTMGYPLRHTPLYTLLDQAIELQIQRRKTHFHHQSVIALLGHTYILDFDEKNKAQELCAAIIRKNRIRIPCSALQTEVPLSNILFQIIEPQDALVYILQLIEEVKNIFIEQKNADFEYAVYLYERLSSLHETLCSVDIPPNWVEFRKLYRYITLTERVPFKGESLDGLQIMGVLETRNLDFENVYILSLNEGLFPAPAPSESYIPYRIRKAYGLPTHDDQDSMYAYLFYRLLQRAKRIRLYYSTGTDRIGEGGMSRYLKQLIYESGLPIQHYLSHNMTHLPDPKPIRVPKGKEVYDLLKQYRMEEGCAKKALTPSALNDYLDCGLRFYLKHIARLREADQVEEQPDARVLGNLIHHAAFQFYNRLTEKNSKKIEKNDLEHSEILLNKSIDNAFEAHYSNVTPDMDVTYRGQRFIAHALVQEWMAKSIERDKVYAPFTIVALEKEFTRSFRLNDFDILLGGTIDRIDRKNDTLRIIDYKTGGDESVIHSISSLFDRKDIRNKAAFQTFFYAYLYADQEDHSDARVVPILLNRKKLFGEHATFSYRLGKGKNTSYIENIRPYFQEFETLLRTVLEELYDQNIPFSQTQHVKTCAFCPYRSMCSR